MHITFRCIDTYTLYCYLLYTMPMRASALKNESTLIPKP